MTSSRIQQIFFLIFFSLYLNPTYAQLQETTEFIGSIKLSNNDIYTYKLVIKSRTNNHFQGYTITDIWGKNRTQSSVKGEFHSDNSLSFKETNNTYSSSAADEFCFIRVEKAYFKNVRGKQILMGSFKGVTPKGKPCGNGNLYLISQKEAEAFIQPSEIDKKLPDSLNAAKQKAQDLLKQSTAAMLRGGQQVNINVNQSSVSFEIWDGGGAEDNDEIAILVDGKVLVDHLVITTEKYTFPVEVTKPVVDVKVIALNEGKWKPCTANITVFADGHAIPITSSMRKNETAIMRLIRKTE